MTDQEIMNELIKRLHAVDLSGLDTTPNHWHNALVHVLAAVIVDNAKDWDDAGRLIFETKKDIEHIVIKNRDWAHSSAKDAG